MLIASGLPVIARALPQRKFSFMELGDS